jgi:hypothetical protein
MSHTTTMMDLTRGELSVLRSAAMREKVWYGKVLADGNREGWYDAKEKERVTVYLYEAEKLFKRIDTRIKEMDQ